MIKQEWQHQLRSSLHPALFAAVYYVVEKLLTYVGCFPQFRAMIFSVLPNVVQGIFAATGDYYTWQLAERMYGIGSSSASAVVCCVMRDEENLSLTPPVFYDYVQSLAMVLFNKNVFKFPRDDIDHCGTVLLALASFYRHHAGTWK